MLLMSQFTSFYIVYPLTNYCSYSYFVLELINTTPYYRIRVFWISLYSYLYQCFLYFLYLFMLLISTLILSWRISFTISYKAGLVLINSIGFLLSLIKSLSRLQFWRIALMGKIFLVSRVFFYFSALNISFHSLLICKASAEKSAISLIGIPLYVRVFFFLILF